MSEYYGPLGMMGRRMAKSTANLALVAMAFPILTACAAPVSSGPAIAPQQMAAVKRACLETMQLPPHSSELSDCVDSLNESLAERTQASMVAHADEQGREACTQKGLAPDSGDYAVCVLGYQERALDGHRLAEGY